MVFISDIIMTVYQKVTQKASISEQGASIHTLDIHFSNNIQSRARTYKKNKKCIARFKKSIGYGIY